jgi:hypothetical protein
MDDLEKDDIEATYFEFLGYTCTSTFNKSRPRRSLTVQDLSGPQ